MVLSSARMKITYSCPGSRALFSKPLYTIWLPRVKDGGMDEGLKLAAM